MFTNTIKETKKKINITIAPSVYQAFSELTSKRLQPKSWVIEQLMRNYINNTK